MEILVGADPELFVQKAKQFVSGFGLIKGDKANPHRVENGAVQVDGMALEFNIDPANSEQQFAKNIKSVMEQLASMVEGYELVAVPVAPFGAEYISQQPLEARELGCDPDYNAWSGEVNEKPDEDLPFRTGAGHVHIGWTDNMPITGDGHIASCRKVVQQMDFFLGLPSLFFDDDVQRREMYGAAGAYRVKPYGVEYRTLSNKWVSSAALTEWVFRATQAAVKALFEGRVLSDKWGDIQTIINTSDKEAALAIINEEGLELPNV